MIQWIRGTIQITNVTEKLNTMIISSSTNYNEVAVLPYQVQEQLLENANTKYRCIFLLMLDCGLRVTETIRLQIKHFDFFKQAIIVKSLKKRGKQLYRTIPMTQRLIDALGEYWKRLKDKTPDAYIFPPGKKSSKPHLNRIQVWRQIKKHTSGFAYPHMCRHTFATRVVNEGNDIRVAQNLLGHASQQTTEIYLHVAEIEKRKAIQSIQKIPFYIRWYQKLFPPQKIILTPTTAGMTRFHIGRKKELKKLIELKEKKVNIYLNGPQGIGKSQLLDSIQGEKILRIDEFSGKRTLVNLLVEIFESDKQGICSMLYGIEMNDQPLPKTKDLVIDQLSQQRADLTKIITKESIKRLIELAIQVTQPQEYTIIIDDATNLTKSGVIALEKLKNHFHLIVAARNIKIDKGAFLTNFEKIELLPLNRAETTELLSLIHI